MYPGKGRWKTASGMMKKQTNRNSRGRDQRLVVIHPSKPNTIASAVSLTPKPAGMGLMLDVKKKT